MKQLPPQAIEQVADYFKALSEPTRLHLLSLLRERERSVGEMASLTGFTAANVSRHLSFLATQGLVDRQARGTSVYYRISDPAVYKLCDLVCGAVGARVERQARSAPLLQPAVPGGGPRSKPRPAGRRPGRTPD